MELGDPNDVWNSDFRAIIGKSAIKCLFIYHYFGQKFVFCKLHISRL